MAQVNYGAHINLSDNQILNAVLQHVTSDPTGVEGKIIYRSDNNTFKVYDGSNWLTLSTGAGDVTGVGAGAGLTGTDLNGPVPTLNVIGGTGITANADNIAITAGGVGTTQLADDAVTYAKMQNLGTADRVLGSTSTGVIGETQIVTDMIANDAVTEDKLGNALLAEIDANTAKATNVSTNLGITGDAEARVITSSDGNNVTIPVATTSVSGLMNPTIFDEITANNAKNTNVVQTTISGLAGEATVLANSRNFRTNLASTAVAGFTGAAACNPGVTGTLATGNGGTGAANLNHILQTAGAQTITGSKTFSENTKLVFRDGNSFMSSPTANDIEMVATTITLDAASDIQLEGNTTVTGNISVTGNLNIDGTTTTIDSTTVAIADSMLKLAKDQANTADALDFGFYGQYGVGGTHKYAGVFRDGSVTGDPFTFFDSLQAEPGTTVNTGGTGYDLADISAGKITSADGFVGALTGNASGSAGTVTSIGNLTGDVVSTNRATTIGNNKVTYAKMQDLGTANRVLGATSTGDIGEVQIVVGMMAANSVDSAQYVNASIDNEHLADNAVDTDEIAASAVETAKINNAAVTMEKLANVATDTIIGRTASGTGVPKAMSAAEVRAVLGVEASSTADQTKGDIDGLAITTVGTLDTGNATAIVSAASATAAGKVELATTAEALAGTDTARAVTAAGLAARSYKGTIGDGSATAITVDHGLSTRDVVVQMYDASSYETIYAQVVRTTAARVTVTFNVAPANNDIIILINKIQ